MVDISRIDLGELDKEGLEKVKLMLDISKIQADIAESQARIKQADATIEQMRVNTEVARQSIVESQKRVSQTDLNMAEIQKRMQQADVTIEHMRATNDKIAVEVDKMRKETQWFPWLQIITTFLTGGVVVFVLTKLLS